MRTLTLPDRRSAGAVRGEAVCHGLRGCPPCVPANLKAGRVKSWLIICVAPVSLTGGWQGRRLLLMSGNTFKNAKRECEKSSKHQRQQTFRTLNECRHSSLFSPLGCDKHSTTGNLPSKGYTAPYKLLPVNAAVSCNGRSGITYNLNNVCNAGAPRSQVQRTWLRVSAEYAQAINDEMVTYPSQTVKSICAKYLDFFSTEYYILFRRLARFLCTALPGVAVKVGYGRSERRVSTRTNPLKKF